jgi:hypothetical protein
MKSPEEFRKIFVSKFLLNLLVEILKVLPNSKIYLNLKIKTLFIPSLYQPSQPLLAHPTPPASLFLLHCAAPLLPGLPPPFAGPLGPRAPLAYLWEYIFS